MLDTFLLIARVVLAAVFGVAGVAKLADRTGSRSSLTQFGVPAFVKIDAEGHEMEVLRGLKRTLTVSTPAVFVECLGGAGFAAVRTFLEGFGYSSFVYLGPDGPCDLEDGPTVVAGFPNYLCRKGQS